MYGNDWRSALELIKAQKAELQEYSGMMTQYEISIAQREIKDTLTTWKPRIVAALIEQQTNAINDYHYYGKKLGEANKNEVNRWDASRFKDELDVAKALVDQALSGKHVEGPYDGGSPSTYKRIEAMYHDAQKSGDIFKQRAVCEVLQGIEIKTGDYEMNHLRKDAERDLAVLRRTPEQEQVEAEREVAWQKVLERTNEIIVSAPIIDQDATGGYANAFELGRAVSRVQIREDGSRVILEPDQVNKDFVMPKSQSFGG